MLENLPFRNTDDPLHPVANLHGLDESQIATLAQLSQSDRSNLEVEKRSFCSFSVLRYFENLEASSASSSSASANDVAACPAAASMKGDTATFIADMKWAVAADDKGSLPKRTRTND